jgi:hypothetical protein
MAGLAAAQPKPATGFIPIPQQLEEVKLDADLQKEYDAFIEE